MAGPTKPAFFFEAAGVAVEKFSSFFEQFLHFFRCGLTWVFCCIFHFRRNFFYVAAGLEKSWLDPLSGLFFGGSRCGSAVAVEKFPYCFRTFLRVFDVGFCCIFPGRQYCHAVFLQRFMQQKTHVNPHLKKCKNCSKEFENFSTATPAASKKMPAWWAQPRLWSLNSKFSNLNLNQNCNHYQPRGSLTTDVFFWDSMICLDSTRQPIDWLDSLDWLLSAIIQLCELLSGESSWVAWVMSYDVFSDQKGIEKINK